ncbi:MAG TPA: class I adenylate-forming enzyme family protein [Sphingobium sp.]|nr:class I adenylate-forming enzyme family protein [Sphingobium sp.]
MRTVDSILELAAAANPLGLALTLGEESATFGQLQDEANRYAASLQAWGVGKGDVVLLRGRIAIRNVTLHFAMARIGAVFAPLDAGSSAAELKQIVDYVCPRFIVSDEAGLDVAEQIAAGAGIPLAVLSDTDGSSVGTNLAKAAREYRGGAVERRSAPTDLHAMYFTSGSTGRPKAVMVSHQASWLRAQVAQSLNSSRGMVCMFPLFHMAGWLVITQTWAQGRPVHLVARADADTLLGEVQKWQASTLYAIPAVWRRILDCPNRYDTSSLLAVDAGTSYVGQDLIEALRVRFPGARNLVAYGSTEMGMGLQIAHDDILRKPGSVGRPGPTVEARIVNGELQLRGPTMMQGYYRLEAETAEVMDDGWYRTGDLAECDEEGFYTITGRWREIIRSGGKTISPAELDPLLKGLPGIADAAVVGLPDADWGETVSVAVVAVAGQSLPSLDDVRAHLGDVSAYKLPRRIVEVPEIPRTAATGQVRRGPLREMILAS